MCEKFVGLAALLALLRDAARRAKGTATALDSHDMHVVDLQIRQCRWRIVATSGAVA